MAPRKRTTTDKLESATDLAPQPETKPKAARSTAKKPARAEAKAETKAPKTAARKAEPAKKKAPKKAEALAAVEAAPAAAPAVAEAAPEPRAAAKTPRKRAAASEAASPKTPPAEAPLPSLTPHAQQVLAAIVEGRAIELIFADASANPPRTFEARQLIFDVFTGAWFAWGWDRRYNAERHHRLDQIAEINPVEGPGRSAQGPFPEGTPANQIGGWRGGEAIPVKAVLQKQWIFAVRQAPAPFPEFRIEDLEDGKAQVTFTGTDLRAIARWCMQFGDGIQVQEPQRLVDRIKQAGIAWAGKAAAPAPPPPAPKAHPKPEPRPEPKADARPEPRRPEPPRKEPREHREAEAPKGKPARVEVRIERL